MKRIISWILIVIFSLIIVILQSILLIKPGVSDISKGNSIKELSSDDIANEKKKIKQKYLDLAKEIDEKYITKEAELEEEYEVKEKEIDAKYTKQMLEDGWFEDQSKKNDEKSKLSREKSDKSLNFFTQKYEEKRSLSSLQNDEIEKLNNYNSERFSLIVKGVVKVSGALFIIAVFFIWILAQINKVIRSKNKVKESWAQIEVFLKRRYDLIPNIVSTIKGYTKYESKTLETVIEARTEALNTQDKAKEIELNNTISKDVNQILLLEESYPDLKANDNYLSLQEELRNTEDEISNAREGYNKSVLRYQNLIETIPTNIFSNILGYEDELFFSIDEKESNSPEINF